MFFLQNVVNLGAVKVKSNPNIEYINPEKRNCYFDHEHPPNNPLTAHQKYSQVWIRVFLPSAKPHGQQVAFRVRDEEGGRRRREG